MGTTGISKACTGVTPDTPKAGPSVPAAATTQKVDGIPAQAADSGLDSRLEASQGLGREERFKLVSVLLDYPDEYFQDKLREATRVAEEAGDEAVMAAVSALRVVSPPELARCYVATFDLQEATALYLTAHELGDSRERGAALLHLHAMLRAAGLEPASGELPDYLPLLLEFLAEKPTGMPTGDLESRLYVVTGAIAERLEPRHPYRPLFVLLANTLPRPTARGATLAPVKDPDAESDTLPYPLVYD